MRMTATGMSSIKPISMALVSGPGFSNGCALLALKKPPPSPDMSLIGSHDAARPPGISRGVPASVLRTVPLDRFCTTPSPASTIAKTAASGDRLDGIPVADSDGRDGGPGHGDRLGGPGNLGPYGPAAGVTADTAAL